MSGVLARNCPVCAGTAAAPWMEKGELHLVCCRQCSMIYVAAVPAALASGEYYELAGTDYYLSAAKLESDYSDVRFERELRLFRKYCAGGEVLDVGCSTGAFLFQLNRRYPGQYEIVGADVSGAPLDYAESRGVKVVRGNFLEHDFGREKFRAITFWAVIEHLVNPGRFLEKALALLEPGALCFVLVPNVESLAMRLLGSRYRYIYPQHLNYFNSRTLRQLVTPGFEIIEARSTHFNPVVIWQDWRGKGRDVSNTERAALLQKTTKLKKTALLRPVKWLYQGLEAALGKLKLADNLALVLRRN